MIAKLKGKNKEINERVIDRDPLLEVLKSINGVGISEHTVEAIQPLVQVNANHGHIYHFKRIEHLLDEINARHQPNAQIENTATGQVLSFK